MSPNRPSPPRARVPVPLLAAPALLLGAAGAPQPQEPDGAVAQAEAVHYELPPPLEVPDALAATEEEMRPYTDRITGSQASFAMTPIPAGAFLMGSPEGEWRRKDWEGPRREIQISAFWMGVHEVTWDEYEVFMFQLDVENRVRHGGQEHPQDTYADALTRPTPPYVPMDFDMGTQGFPAVSMTQFAARQYTKWLSMKTGRFYRLPTEAEWEYACRAGTTTAYSFGEDHAELAEYGWFYENTDDAYQKVGQLKPNPWGLYDMHGNVSEWTLDVWSKKGYGEVSAEGPLIDPVAWPKKEYPRAVRGGSWDDDPDRLRSAARRGSSSSWKYRDPQIPSSIWYHTDAPFLGFRVVRPLIEPTDEEKARYWEADVETIRRLIEGQQRGED